MCFCDPQFEKTEDTIFLGRRMEKILIYGYGNPGRQDDCLANDLVDRMQEWVAEIGIHNVEFDSNYQLNIEDAEIISHYDTVFFADATIEDIEDFYLSEVSPDEAKVEFSMHAVSPAYVLDLCHKMYHKKPKTYLLHIKGYEWEFMEPMTAKAHENLEKAIAFMKSKIITMSKF